MPLLVIAVAFLCVTIVLVLLQPGVNGSSTQHVAQTPVPTAYDAPLEQQVATTTQQSPTVAYAPQPSLTGSEHAPVRGQGATALTSPLTQPEQPVVTAQVQQVPSPAVTAQVPASASAPATTPPPQPALPTNLAQSQTPQAPLEPTQSPAPRIAENAAQQPRPSAAQQRQPVEDTAVTRTQLPLLSAAPDLPPRSESTAQAITKQLRQPLRLTTTTQRPADLPGLTDLALQQLGAPVFAPVDENLRSLLVDAVLQRQSDTYVAVVLNAALARGEIDVPPGVRTPSGDLDVSALLSALVEASGSELPTPRLPLHQSGSYIVQSGDSLAGLASRYYGRPLDFVHILQANPALRQSGGNLEPGQQITIPAL